MPGTLWTTEYANTLVLPSKMPIACLERENYHFQKEFITKMHVQCENIVGFQEKEMLLSIRVAWRRGSLTFK